MTRRRLPEPRWQTPLPPAFAGSWGPAVIQWARVELGIELDTWQRKALNRALACDVDGVLLHRLYLISTARQQGKTALVRALIGWALTAGVIPPWATIVGLAHDRAQARLPYEAVMVDLATIKRRHPRGGLAITRYLGIRSDLYGLHREYKLGSKESRDALRGTSTDLGVFDEVRTQRTYETWMALEPSTRARPMPLVVAISSAGDDRSVLLRDWWERGLRIIDGAEPARGFGMTWYAGRDDADPGDRSSVLAANPAAAEGRVPLQPILDSIASLTTAGYRQETLNLWSDGGDEWLPPGTWRESAGDQPRAGVQRILFGVEAVPTWRRATVTVAIVTDAGAWVGIAGDLDTSTMSSSAVSPGQLVQLLTDLADAWKPDAIGYSKAAAAAPHVTRWAEGRKLETFGDGLNGRQIRNASQLFRSELVGRRLTHAADPLLAHQARAVRPAGSIESGDWYLSVVDSVGEVDAIRAAAWASWAAIAPEARKIAPQVFL